MASNVKGATLTSIIAHKTSSGVQYATSDSPLPVSLNIGTSTTTTVDNGTTLAVSGIVGTTYAYTVYGGEIACDGYNYAIVQFNTTSTGNATGALTTLRFLPKLLTTSGGTEYAETMYYGSTSTPKIMLKPHVFQAADYGTNAGLTAWANNVAFNNYFVVNCAGFNFLKIYVCGTATVANVGGVLARTFNVVLA